MIATARSPDGRGGQMVTLQAPPAPLVRSCRDVLACAGDVALTLVGDPEQLLAELAAVNPRLARRMALLLDAVMELDYRTDYLTGRD